MVFSTSIHDSISICQSMSSCFYFYPLSTLSLSPCDYQKHRPLYWYVATGAPLDAIRRTFARTGSCKLHREGSVVSIDALLFQSKLLQSMKADAQTELRLETTRRNETLGTSGDVKRAKRLRQRVVHQDAHFVVLDKPQGLAVR